MDVVEFWYAAGLVSIGICLGLLLAVVIPLI
jgi:hypothetical protein